MIGLQFKYCALKTEELDNDEAQPWTSCLDNDGNLYKFSTTLLNFKKNDNQLPNKQYPDHGNELLYYDGFLYFFEWDQNGINEKFHIEKNQWSLFSNQAFDDIDEIYLLNNLFYILYENGKIGKYNPKTDIWQLLDIRLPQKTTELYI